MWKVTRQGSRRAQAALRADRARGRSSASSFISGTLVLTATIQKTFDDLFADINRGTDAAVRGPRVAEGRLRRRVCGRTSRRRSSTSCARRRRSKPRSGTSQAVRAGRRQRTARPSAATVRRRSASAGTRTRSSTSSTSSPASAPRDRRRDRRSTNSRPTRAHLHVGDRGHGPDHAGAAQVRPRRDREVRHRRQPGGRVDHPLHAARGAAPRARASDQFSQISVVAQARACRRTRSRSDIRATLAANGASQYEVITGKALTKENQDAVHKPLGFISTALLVFAFVALDRRHVHHLQHVLDRRRATDARDGAAARDRRDADARCSAR